MTAPHIARLGAPIFADQSTPDAWVQALQSAGYRAAHCLLQVSADDDTVRDYAQAAQKATPPCSSNRLDIKT